MIKSLRIKIPDNPESKNFLKRKLDEYTLKAKKINSMNTDRDAVLYYNSIPGYKAFIINSLLSFGEVETKQIAFEIKEEFGRMDIVLFNQAAQLVYDYCQACGKKVKMISRPEPMVKQNLNAC